MDINYRQMHILRFNDLSQWALVKDLTFYSEVTLETCNTYCIAFQDCLLHLLQ